MEVARVQADAVTSGSPFTRKVNLPDLPTTILRIHKVEYAIEDLTITPASSGLLWMAYLSHNIGPPITISTDEHSYAHASWVVMEATAVAVSAFPTSQVVDLSPGFDVGGPQSMVFSHLLGETIDRIVGLVYFTRVQVSAATARILKARTMLFSEA